MTIKFYLAKKEDVLSKETKANHEILLNEINLISQQIKELGYDNETASEIRHILTRPPWAPIIFTKDKGR